MLRSVSLLDLDDEGTVDPALPMPAANAEPAPAPMKFAAKVTRTVVATPCVQPSRVLEDIETEGVGAVSTEARKDAAGAAEALMGDDTREEGHLRFNELGGILLPHLLNFQGPDIDPYLPWIREVEVAEMIAELSHEIEFGSTKVPLPSEGTSSAVEKRHLEKEFFDVEGTSPPLL